VATDPQITRCEANARRGGKLQYEWRGLVRGAEKVFIYWQYSRVMQRRSARRRFARREKVDVEKYASEAQSEYQIILRGRIMTRSYSHNEEFLKTQRIFQCRGVRARSP